jgi:hypothetical protein
LPVWAAAGAVPNPRAMNTNIKKRIHLSRKDDKHISARYSRRAKSE